MTLFSFTPNLDAFQQARVDLWRAASIELSFGPEATSPFVQAAVQVILTSLRADAATPQALLESYAQPHGALADHLRLIGSLLDADESSATHPSRLCWWVVKTAFYRRWIELVGRPPAGALGA